ncbi:MAG: GNAT family N-acetyltransferase [Planctomycetota bacterium]
MSRAAPARRRVLLLVDEYDDPYGGTEGQILTLLAGLPPGWEAELWVLRPSAWLEAHAFPCPTRSLRLGSLARPRTARRLLDLAREIRRRRFDLVQTFMNDASIVGPLLGARADVPVLLARRDLGFWQTPRLLAVLRRTDRWAAGVLANCEAVRKHTIAAEHVPPADVRVIPNGHDPARFDVLPEPHLRERLRIPAEAPLVGLLANVKPLKRHDDFLDALVLLGARHEDVHALLIGDAGEAASPLRGRIRRRGLQARVHEVAALGNAIPLLLHLDVGVLCSESEGLSNALLEYMACGLPIVATNVGGTPELVEEGENGFLYAPGDVEGLREGLDRLLADPTLRRRMGEASRRLFAARFTADRMVEATTTAWAAVLRPRAGSPDETLTWEVVDSLQALEALADPWDALLTPDRLFTGPDWVLAALAHAGGGPHVLVARDAGGALAGVVPLARRPGGGLAFAGQDLGADHLDVVAAPGREAAVARGALERIGAWREGPVRLRHLAEDGALRLAIRHGPFPYGERLASVCPYVRVAGRSYETYVAEHFSKPSRRNIRRYPRRFRAREGAAVERVTSPQAAAAAVDRYYALHDRRFAGRGQRSAMQQEGRRAFHQDLARRLAARGRLAVTFLRLGARDVACEYDFRLGPKIYAFQSGFDESAPLESPGMVLQAIVLEEDVFGRGRAEYDFLDGAEEYKQRWATDRRRVFDVRLGRHGPAAAAMGGLPHLLRDALRGAPPS